jgi:hypothetical protein
MPRVRQALPQHGPITTDFEKTAWQIQGFVNRWFRDNHYLWPVSDLTSLAQQKALHSDPDGNWYLDDGRPKPDRLTVDSLRGESFWRAAEPLFDFLHQHYKVAWTYTVLMLQPSKQFRGTPRNLGVGDHFTGREQVIFDKQTGAQEARTGWHANQFPPFIVQQKLHEEPPFEIISTYALNILHLKDALPLTITRLPDCEEDHVESRVISVSRFDEFFRQSLPDFLALIDAMWPHYDHGDGGWAHGGKDKLKPHFAQLDKEAMKILANAHGDVFRILKFGPDADAKSKIESRLRRPGRTNLALVKYLILMTAVWPQWTRIIMIPHRVPVFSDPQPGGIVICEDTQSATIPVRHLQHVGDLLSASIWPWVSLQSGKRSEIDSALRIVERMSAAILHEHNWAFMPVNTLLQDEQSWKSMSRAKADLIKAGIKITADSLTALCGLADKPGEWKTVYLENTVRDLGKQFARLGSRFKGRTLDVTISDNCNAAVPRLYVAILIEVIRNAFKHSEEHSPGEPVRLTVESTPDGQTLSIIIRNPANEEKVNAAVERYREIRTLFDTTDHILASTDSLRKGIPLVMVLVEFARGTVEYRLDRDGDQPYLVVQIMIHADGEHYA